MTGRTISRIIKGQIGGEDALVFMMTNGSTYLLQSGSSSGLGMLMDIEKIDEAPDNFEPSE